MRSVYLSRRSGFLRKALLLLIACCFSVTLFADPPSSERPPIIDLRHHNPGKGHKPSIEQASALKLLKSRIPGLEVSFDPLLLSPRSVRSPDGPLSGPKGEGLGVSRNAAKVFAEDDPDRSVKVFLKEHRKLFGHGEEILKSARRTRDYKQGSQGHRAIVWDQWLDGIPVYGSVFIAHLGPQEELSSLSSTFVSDPQRAADAGHPKRKQHQQNPAVSARQALAIAIQSVGETVTDDQTVLISEEPKNSQLRHLFKPGPLPGEAEVKLVWLPLDGQHLRLCWQVEVNRRHRGERFRLMIDTESGQVLLRRCITFDSSVATYRVFTGESPSPFSPGHNTPSRVQPPLVQRELVTFSALNTNASPIGWIGEAENETRGNNVDARLDSDGDNFPDFRPQGSPWRMFDFPLDLTQSPTNYRAASVVQLFYWCNWMHDRLYALGFTEEKGNFQKDNFGRGGNPQDPVIADAQDGSGLNNANYTPQPDGTSPRIQMFMFNGPDPWRDATLDASVILHEYAHGLTDRMVAGGVGFTGGNQPFGLAEGWSDFYSMALLSKPGDDPDAVYPSGGYMSYNYLGLKENYYFGIRRYPYTTDMTKNPLTFRHLYDDDAPDHPEIPRNPIITSYGPESHRMGEVWCTILWEARANFIRKYGYEVGNELILKIVTEGLDETTMPNPTFIEARNAILDADKKYHSAANQALLWAAFAKRGMGISASTWEAQLFGYGLTEAFDLPGVLQLQVGPGYLPTGPVGGPFVPSSTTWQLRNLNHEEIIWRAGSSTNWLQISPVFGKLWGDTSTNITLSVNALASSFPKGVYTNLVWFTNVTANQVLTQEVLLRVDQPYLLSGGMAQDHFDLDFFSFTFTPISSNSYAVCKFQTAAFPTDPSGGEELLMVDDCYQLVRLTNSAEICILGVRSNAFLIGSNGDLQFVPPPLYETNGSPDFYTHYFHANVWESLRAAPLYADLDPSAGGTVSWKQFPEYVAVTYQNVPEFGQTNVTNFQIELFTNGVIRYSYCGTLVSNYVRVGFSTGLGLNYEIINLRTNPSCYGYSLNLPARVTEGDPPLTGILHLEPPAIDNMFFTLRSSDTNAVVVTNLYVPEGMSYVPFTITILDDALLNGTREVKIIAQAQDYEPIENALEVADNETATLSLSLPAEVGEQALLLEDAGVIGISALPDAPITVRLSSTDTNLVRVPEVVVIPSGQLSNTFHLEILDNQDLAPSQVVTISATVENWTGASQQLIVVDNESRQLGLQLPASLPQTTHTYPNAGRIRIGGFLATNLPIQISTQPPGIVVVPAPVWLPPGSNEVLFTVGIIDHKQATNVLVTLTATAFGFSSTNVSLWVGGVEPPSAPVNPSPLHAAIKVPQETTLAWATAGAEPPGSISFELYFGTNPVPGIAEYQTTTTNNVWPLPRLAFGQTYFWQIVCARGSYRVSGPVWTFRTLGLSHFEFSEIPSPQRLRVPFDLVVTAKDENQQTTSEFAGPANLSAVASTPADTILISEVDVGLPNQVEFVNVSTRDIEISGWQVAVYDWTTWPEPRARFVIPGRVVCPAGDVFVLQRSPPTTAPGAYPRFLLGSNLAWNRIAIGNPIAVVLMDPSGNIVDFMCAADADPRQITFPTVIPSDQWRSSPVPATLYTTRSLQRQGTADHNSASDWVVATTNTASLNPGLVLPFSVETNLAATPLLLSNFVNGIWTGQVSVNDLVPLAALRVDDGHGHTGVSGSFAVTAPDALLLKVTPPTNVPRFGNTFSLLVQVSNTGPAAATGLLLQNQLPPGAELVGVEAAAGTWAVQSGQLVFQLDALDAGTAVTLNITLRPTQVGVFTNWAIVSCAESFLPSAPVETRVTVEYPWLSIYRNSFREGNSNTTALFPVFLSDPVSNQVSVAYHTSDDTALAGLDYLATSGVLVFAPGATNANVPVTILGNWYTESNKSFYIFLDEATNAVVVNSPGIVAISNDDLTYNINLWITDAAVVEGDEGTTNAIFTVSLNAPSTRTVLVSYISSNVTASAGMDYAPVVGGLEFEPGVTNRTFSVPIYGDRFFESNETFLVRLLYPFNAGFARSIGTGTILDDDAAKFHRFVWDVPSTNQYAKMAFPATLTAVDAFGKVITAYSGPVEVTAGQQVTLGSGTTLSEYPFGANYHDLRMQVIYPYWEIGRAGRITELALRLSMLPGQVLNQWTIRMKHTTVTNFVYSPAWADFAGSLVYQGNLSMASTGWVSFPFQQPFDFNGTNWVMVDFSFNNTVSSSDGLCYATPTNIYRSLACRSDSAFGNPLNWAGGIPAGTILPSFPNTRFTIDNPVGVSPVTSGLQSVQSAGLGEFNLVGGVWTGSIILDQPGFPITLSAQSLQGYTGVSKGLLVVPPFALHGQQSQGQFHLSFPTLPDRRYQIESTANPGTLIWTPVSEIFYGTGALYQLTNTISSQGNNQFYRVRLVP